MLGYVRPLLKSEILCFDTPTFLASSVCGIREYFNASLKFIVNLSSILKILHTTVSYYLTVRY